MINAIIISMLTCLAGCAVHAHTPPHPPQQRYHTPAPRAHAPHHNQAPVRVKAWVWVKAHRDARGVYHRGYWELRTIPRHMVNRHPHTHVRYVKGRGRPSPPDRRYR